MKKKEKKIGQSRNEKVWEKQVREKEEINSVCVVRTSLEYCFGRNVWKSKRFLRGAAHPRHATTREFFFFFFFFLCRRLAPFPSRWFDTLYFFFVTTLNALSHWCFLIISSPFRSTRTGIIWEKIAPCESRIPLNMGKLRRYKPHNFIENLEIKLKRLIIFQTHTRSRFLVFLSNVL